MWMVSTEKASRASIRLASISIESPTNLQLSGEIGLLVGVWCQIAREPIRGRSTGTRHDVRFGFREGNITVRLEGGYISNSGRLQVPESTIVTKQSETADSEKIGGLSGALALPIKLLDLVGAKIGLEGKLQKSARKSLSRTRDQNHPIWRIVSADEDVWHLSGVGLNENGVLENRIIGNEPLCYIRSSHDSDCDIKIEVAFSCDLRDLWFAREPGPVVKRDETLSAIDDERNRAAICTAIVATALRRERIDESLGSGSVTLAMQIMNARQIQSPPTSA